MRVKKIDNVYAVRLCENEKIVESIYAVCRAEGIRTATVNAIGAVKFADVGLYSMEEKAYKSNKFNLPLELVSLIGNVTRKGEDIHVHVHASFADEKGNVFGGHLTDAVVSVTCEIFLTELNGEIGRKIDDKTGLTVFDI